MRTCNSGTKAAAQRWLDAVGTDMEQAETEKYIGELEADIMPIDNLIQFAQSGKRGRIFWSRYGSQYCGTCKRN